MSYCAFLLHPTSCGTHERCFQSRSEGVFQVAFTYDKGSLLTWQMWDKAIGSQGSHVCWLELGPNRKRSSEKLLRRWELGRTNEHTHGYCRNTKYNGSYIWWRQKRRCQEIGIIYILKKHSINSYNLIFKCHNIIQIHNIVLWH